MSKPPSDATIIRQLRQSLRQEHEIAGKALRDLEATRRELSRAAAEAAEWKRRFDLLLSKTQEVR